MKPDPPAEVEEPGDLLVAACDEALAAGESVDLLLPPDASIDERNRVEQEFAWCRTVRHLLADAATMDFTDEATSWVSPVAPTPKKLGRFHIRRELGRGGYGIVFLALDPELGREVALKIPRPEAIMHPELRARFQQEARATGSLDHPNVVPVYESGEDGAICYIASAYCPGTTLSAWLKERTEPVPFLRAARLASILAEAVEHAHQRNILHRDLKPGNVMLSPRFPRIGIPHPLNDSPGTSADGNDLEFTPRIMDFGLAKVLEDAGTAAEFRTQSGAIVGTPAYMAPEQASGQTRAIGPATDVYSLGAILYELLTGRPPFCGNGTVETLLLVRTQEPLAPGRLRANVPRDLETICLKCLHKDPSKRYGSAQALADDLHRYLTRRPIQARRVGVLGRVTLWCRRKPAQAITIGLAVLAVTFVAGVGLSQVLQERGRYRDERDRAQANLYRSLVSEARALMQARDTAWWWKAMDNIRQAGALEVADRDPGEMRELAIQCMGTEHPCMRLHGIWEGHAGPITCTAFSKDGRLVASGARDKTVRLWSVPDGRLIAVLHGHTQAVTGVAFHPAGKSIVSSSADGSVRVWDIASLERPESPPSSEVVELRAGAVNALEWSPDGARLFAACADGTIQVLTFKQGTPLAKSERRTLSGHSGPVMCLAYSENGLLASGSQDKTIRVWNLPTGQETDVLATNEMPNALDFDAGGHQLWWGQPENHSIVRRNLQSGRTIAYGMLHPGPVRQFRIGKSGLLTAASDGTVKWWTAHSAGGGDRLIEGAVARGAWGDARAFAVNADGNWIAAGYADGRLRLWEMAYPPQRTLVNSDRSAKQQAVFLGSERVLVNAGWLHDFSRNWNEPAQGYFPESLSALAVHPAGRWFAYASEQGALAIGDHLRPDVRIACSGHTQRVSALVVLSDGKRLASASADGSIKLWSWETGACQGTFEPNLGPLHALAWSADHRALAITGERGLTICAVDADPVVMRPIKQHALRHSSVAVFADFLAAGGTDGTVEIWDFQTGRKLHALGGHKQLVSALAFSPDGKLLASAAANDTIRLWDVDKEFTEHAVIDAPSQASAWSPSLAFAPDGKYLAASLTGPTRIWRLDAKSPLPIAELDGRPGRFTADGSGLIAGASNGAVQEWAIADVVETRAQAQGKTEMALSNFVTRVRPPKTLVKGGHTHMIWGIAASPDGRWIASASADRTVKLWDARTRKLVRTLEGHTDVVWSVAFSPDSKYLASGSEERGSGVIKIWEAATGKEHLHFLGHKRLVFSLAFHPDRPWLVSSSLDGSVCLWDVAAGKAIGLLHQFDQPVYSVAFRPDGNWLAASCLDNRVALWELPALPNGSMPPTRYLEGHRASVYAVGFSADGRFLATGSEQGEMILWDADTFARITSLRAGTGQIRGISFSRDGQLLVGAAYGSPTIVWDLSRVRRTLADMNLDW